MRTTDANLRVLVRRQRWGRKNARGVARVHPGLLNVLHHRADVRRPIPSQTASTSISIALSRKRSINTGRVRPRPSPRRSNRRALRGRRAHTKAGSAPGSRCAPRRHAPLRCRGRSPTPGSGSRAARAAPRTARDPLLRRLRRTACPGSGSRRLPAHAQASAASARRTGWRRHQDARARRRPSTSSSRERLEVEAVGCVVVRRDGLRIAVDHHGLVAERAEPLRSVHAAVVELDALPDPVRPRAEDDDTRLRAERRRLVNLAVGGVVVVDAASTSPAHESTRR